MMSLMVTMTKGNCHSRHEDCDGYNGQFYQLLRMMDPTLPYLSIIALFLWGLGSFWSKFMA